MTEPLYTLAYPELPDADRAWIEAYRRRHDLPFRDVVAAHVTLVFGTARLAATAYCAHVAEVAARSEPVDFMCRYAMQGVDDSDDTGYVFLVPDEGFSSIATLHDRLYAGPLEPSLRLNIPYIPHITIGTVPSHGEARALCDALNARGPSVAGRISRLTVSAMRGGKVADLAVYELGG